MNKEERRINNKCNFIDNLLLDNGLYKGVSALVEIEEHISNLYDEIDEYKHQLEEKDKIIDKVSERLKLLGKYDGGICTRNFKMMSADFNQLIGWLERGKNGK